MPENFTTSDLIALLQNYPPDTQLRIRDFEEYSEVNYDLVAPRLEFEGDTLVITEE